MNFIKLSETDHDGEGFSLRGDCQNHTSGGSPVSLLRMDWDHEPKGENRPLTPTLSPE